MTELAYRVFKTRWFTKAARDAGISDQELCRAAEQLFAGQADDLGGNVWKKRLSKNTHRSIVVNKVGEFWVFVFLFAKADMENIDARELKDFKKLAKDFRMLTRAELDGFVESRTFMEIFNA
ncbi:type II toxin-antitoxin system RelE/ParE family toxin [Cupriavidus pampae]|uniref:Addiction module toxin RelE n=1 Tax=Cupriavidus pampae TaxID=659251 RepID=A0ABM8Y0Q3_9BURK|nr:type II toxin-antitoxin system RelE/ParE family toxin [Cupriavidus pampae]CAG9186305.1 hypothetical protein LMG32289_06364 [Cupriavidus pampae]